MYFRFEGRLWEDMHFQRVPSWETEKIAIKPKEGNGEYLVEILNENGEMISSSSPYVDFRQEMPSDSNKQIYLNPSKEKLSTDVVAYLQAHTRAQELVFRRGSFVIHREKIAEQPPTIDIKEVTRTQNGQIVIRWNALHPHGRPLHYNVIYVIDRSRAFLLVRGLKDNIYMIPSDSLPGSDNSVLAVLATDGLRSSFDISEPFRVEKKPPRIQIQTPVENQVYPADQPISLCGMALDDIAIRLPARGLSWRVDNNIVAEDCYIAYVKGLDSGLHNIALRYTVDGQIISEATISIRVAPRTDAQKEIIKFLNENNIG